MIDQTCTVGPVLSIALLSAHLGQMRETTQAQAVAGGCLVGDHSSSLRRGLTLLASGQWQQVLAALGIDLPWHTRRANVLIDAEGMGYLIGRKVRIGDVCVHIHNKTVPCAEMDQIFPGLRKVLAPDCRGGVYGQILAGGCIKVGDLLVAEGD